MAEEDHALETIAAGTFFFHKNRFNRKRSLSAFAEAFKGTSKKRKLELLTTPDGEAEHDLMRSPPAKRRKIEPPADRGSVGVVDRPLLGPATVVLDDSSDEDDKNVCEETSSLQYRRAKVTTRRQAPRRLNYNKSRKSYGGGRSGGSSSSNRFHYRSGEAYRKHTTPRRTGDSLSSTFRSAYFEHESAALDPIDNPFVSDELLAMIDLDSPCHSAQGTVATTSDASDRGHNVDPKFNRSFVDTIDLTSVLCEHFGFSSFRDGQEEAIRRILYGKSTLLIIPTGAGKSLCYQLPAFIIRNSSKLRATPNDLSHSDGLASAGKSRPIALVVSPLVSLMSDQISRLPNCLKGIALNSHQSAKATADAMAELSAGNIDILFVSPEKVVSRGFSDLVRSGTIPPIAFAAIDEAHCVSEWSHNFRTSYLRLHRVLRATLGVETILALTATATVQTEKSIAHSFGIPLDGIVRPGTPLRSNLLCSVSHVLANTSPLVRQRSLLALLKQLADPTSRVDSGDVGNDRKRLGSTIVYCMLKKQADELADFLQLQGFAAASYHAGRQAEERRRLQSMFDSGKIEVIVATVAFGMGIDKPDVRHVIHYSLPKSIENYVQEIGRAGRDGLPARCHLFLADDDFVTLRSLAYAEGVDRDIVHRFLKYVFGNEPASHGTGGRSSVDPGEADDRFVVLPHASLEETFDLKKESMETILSLLDVESDAPLLRMLPGVSAAAIVWFQGKTDPHELARRSGEALVATLLSPKFSSEHTTAERGGRMRVNLVALASAMAANAGKVVTLFDIQRELARLAAAGEIGVELRDPAFYVKILRHVTNQNSSVCLAEASERVARKLDDLELAKVHKIHTLYKLLQSVASREAAATMAEADHERNLRLHSLVDEYFRTVETPREFARAEPSLDEKAQAMRRFLEKDVRVFLSGRKSESTDGVRHSGRSIARIFHGISSPAFPAETWRACPFWGRHKEVDFHTIREVAEQALKAQVSVVERA